MTRTEAAALLGVSESAPVAEMRRRYEALHNDYQIRLTNAPTPALKKTYQQKLQELIDACRVLQPEFTPEAGGGDLPSAEPTIGDVTLSHVRGPIAPRAENRPRAGPHVATADQGLPRSTIIAGLIAVVFAGAFSFVALRLASASHRASQLETQDAKLAQTVSALQAAADANQGLFYADRLRVKNVSKKTARIVAATFVYRDASGGLKVAHSGNYNYPTWDIRPGGITQLDSEMARGRLWDGPVVYYAFLVEYPGSEPFLKAGLWAPELDRLDKAIALDLD